MSGAIPDPTRAMADLMRAAGLTPPVTSMPNVDEVLRGVQKQRELIRSTVTNLEALDAQLALFEASLAPFAAAVLFWERMLGIPGKGADT